MLFPGQTHTFYLAFVKVVLMASATKSLIRRIVAESSEIRSVATQRFGYGFPSSLSKKIIG